MSRLLWFAIVSAVAPVIAYVIAAAAHAPEDCVQCPLLFTIGGAYLFAILLPLNLSYLLTLIPAPPGWRILLVAVSTLFPSAAFIFLIVNSHLHADGSLNANADYVAKVPAMYTLSICNAVACVWFSIRRA